MPVLSSYRNQSIDLHSKSIDLFLNEATLALNGLKHLLYLYYWHSKTLYYSLQWITYIMVILCLCNVSCKWNLICKFKGRGVFGNLSMKDLFCKKGFFMFPIYTPWKHLKSFRCFQCVQKNGTMAKKVLSGIQDQNQPSIGVLRKRRSENMRQIYRRTPMPKCDFNKVSEKLYWNYTSTWVFSYKLAAYFQNTSS